MWLYDVARAHEFVRLGVVASAVYLPYVVAAFVIIWIGVTAGSARDRFWLIAEAGFGVLIARFFIVELVRLAWYSARPYVALMLTPLIAPEYSSSLPSGHASILFALALFAGLRSRRMGLIGAVLALVVSLGRIAAGVHWPTDIVAGVVAGCLGTSFAYHATPVWRRIAERYV